MLLSEGYGVKDMETQEPVTSDTLFQIASTTKAFTAALLANVVAADRRSVIHTHTNTHTHTHTTHTFDFIALKL